MSLHVNWASYFSFLLHSVVFCLFSLLYLGIITFLPHSFIIQKENKYIASPCGLCRFFSNLLITVVLTYREKRK